MLVLLPSRGIYGVTKVKLKTPTFNEIREVNNYNVENIYREYRFIELLTNKLDLSKITYFDFRYLFNLAAFNVLLNIIRFPITCKSCGTAFTHNVQLTDLDIVQLSKIKLPYKKYVGGIQYSFRLLSAKDVYDAYLEAQYEDNEEQAFEDLKVSKILSLDLEQVKQLPVSVYIGALLFNQSNFHGLKTVTTSVCPKCGRKYTFNFDLNSKALSFSAEALMGRYSGVSQLMTLNDFLSLSVNEFNALVSEFNKSV